MLCYSYLSYFGICLMSVMCFRKLIIFGKKTCTQQVNRAFSCYIYDNYSIIRFALQILSFKKALAVSKHRTIKYVENRTLGQCNSIYFRKTKNQLTDFWFFSPARVSLICTSILGQINLQIHVLNICEFIYNQ